MEKLAKNIDKMMYITAIISVCLIISSAILHILHLGDKFGIGIFGGIGIGLYIGSQLMYLTVLNGVIFHLNPQKSQSTTSSLKKEE